MTNYVIFRKTAASAWIAIAILETEAEAESWIAANRCESIQYAVSEARF